MLTAALGGIWFGFGPYPRVYLFSGYILIGLWLIVTHLKHLKKSADLPIICGGIQLIAITGLAYWGAENPEMFASFRPAIAQHQSAAEVYASLWPSANRPSADGYITSEDGAALRVIASGPNVSLFRNKEMRFPLDVCGVMKPWQRYFAFGKSENAILVGTGKTTDPAQRAWVYDNECYVLRTDLELKFVGPSQIFESFELAKAGKKPIEKRYEWRAPADKSGGDDQINRIPEFLPVVQYVDGVYRFMRPDGVDWGFPLCWVRNQGGSIQIKHLRE